MPKKDSQIRVRFAPSPTGDPHIGNARSALYNYLFAKKHKGKFFLRIEDTDRARFVPGGQERIMEALKWLGLDWDGEPVIQSERLDLYKKSAEQLIKDGHAYYCFCTPERLETVRKEQEAMKLAPCYDRHCRDLDQKTVEANLKSNLPYVVRLKVPLTGSVEYSDLIKGKISFDLKTIDDPILLKSDGYPTYHLASVVDDHDMKISHVIRSDEWLSSVPKHLLLYQFFGYEAPVFAHLPMVLAPDKTKLSKRHGATAVMEFKDQGYLPDALVNFLAFLGWNPGDEREIFSLKELAKAFELEKVHKSPAIFNLEKLDWLNGYYIRQKPLKELAKLCLPYLEQAGLVKKDIDLAWLERVIALEQERMKKLSEISESTEFIFKDELGYDADLLVWKKMTKETVGDNLRIAKDFFEGLAENDFTKDKLEKNLKALIEEKQIATGEILWPLRVALTGRKASPGPFEVAAVLGKEKTLGRIKKAIEKIS